jgi:hypothetical protein
MKANKNFILTIGFVWISCIASAQTDGIFVPLEVQKAIKKGTRTTTGFPGKKYFQNKADYKIKTSFDPKSGILKGEETILYFNNSPDTLRNILFNIYQDIFKKGNNRSTRVDPEDLTDGVKIDKLIANGDAIGDSLWRRTSTFLSLRLKKFVLPGTTSEFQVSWQLHIPVKTHIRMGTYDTTSFFIAYWYPQIAVYDDIDGWDRIAHVGLQEFYREYAHFDVEITMPQNYLVWATGLLQNSGEIFTDELLNKLAYSEKSDTTCHIVTDAAYKAGNMFRSSGTHVWKFVADNVLDFAFGTSDHYLWDACSAIINPQTGQRVKVNAAYRKQSNFTKAAGIAAKSIQLLSNELYNVSFPYPVLTVFDGGPGGMEFPMIVNNQSSRNNRGTIGLTTHEIAHTYFPYYVGTNEQKNAWLDEGLTSYITEKANEYYDTAYPLAKFYKKEERFPAVRSYNNWMGSELDVPLMILSSELNQSYRNQAYTKSSVAYHFMEEFLGKELFTKALKEFMSRWNGKHPVPTDFFFTFNEVCKQDLSWFFKPWFYEMEVADLALENATIKSNHLKVSIHRKGNLPVPVKLTVQFADGSIDIIYAHSDIWKNSSPIYKIDKKYNKQIKKLVLGDDSIPDFAKGDNSIDF